MDSWGNSPTVDVYLYDIREDLRRRERAGSTSTTNHGFDDGVTTFQSIRQKGTAVLIDDSGCPGSGVRAAIR